MWQAIAWIMIAVGVAVGAFLFILLPLNTLKTYWEDSNILERVIGSVSAIVLPIGFWLFAAYSGSVDFPDRTEANPVFSLIGVILAVGGFVGIVYYYPNRGEKHLQDRRRKEESSDNR